MRNPAINKTSVPKVWPRLLTLIVMSLISLTAQSQTQPIITTVLGGGAPEGSAAAAPILVGWDVTVDSSGNVYALDILASRVYRVDTAGQLTIAIGNGTHLSFTDITVPAVDAPLFIPTSVRAEAGGTVLVSVLFGGVYRYDPSTGDLTRIAGSGTLEFSFGGDEGGPALDAQLGFVEDLATDSIGNIYIADDANCTVRKVETATGIITTLAGTGLNCDFSIDGGQATSTTFRPLGVAVDGNGNIFILETEFFRIRRVDAVTGVVTTVAGTQWQTGSIDGEGGDTRDDLGDGGLAVAATLHTPSRVRVDAAGNLFIADSGNGRVRRIDALTGIITTVAGGGAGGDGGAATSARLNFPAGIDFAGDGSLLVAEEMGVRSVDSASGFISTVAGLGIPFPEGNTSADEVMGLTDTVVGDGAGNIYTDSSTAWIRKWDVASDTVSTFAGDPSLPRGFSGDGGGRNQCPVFQPRQSHV